MNIEIHRYKTLIKFILTLTKTKSTLKKWKIRILKRESKKEEITKIGWNVIALLLVLSVTAAFFAMILWLAKKYLSRRP